jgi:hypothetical protein
MENPDAKKQKTKTKHFFTNTKKKRKQDKIGVM